MTAEVKYSKAIKLYISLFLMGIIITAIINNLEMNLIYKIIGMGISISITYFSIFKIRKLRRNYKNYEHPQSTNHNRDSIQNNLPTSFKEEISNQETKYRSEKLASKGLFFIALIGVFGIWGRFNTLFNIQQVLFHYFI